MALLLVARTGVAELHYVDEEQKIVGEPLDVFLTQDELPTSPEELKSFFQKDPITKKQAVFYCLVCKVYVNNLPNMQDHCLGKKHKNNTGKLEIEDKIEWEKMKNENQESFEASTSSLSSPPPSTLKMTSKEEPLYVNPYHQAWAETAEDCLTLVSGPGVAEFWIESKRVDAFDFQQTHKVIPPGFFKKTSNGTENSFYCIVCDLSLYCPVKIKIHCAGREHLKNGMEFSRNKLGVGPTGFVPTGFGPTGGGPTKTKDVPQFQSLQSLMQSGKEPCVGLNQIEEWWEFTELEPPIYSCNLCEVWGSAPIIYSHIINETHRRKQLISRFPVLEKMINGMDRIELLERAKEEEEKVGGWLNRDYTVIQRKVDDIKHAALKRMSNESRNPVGNPFLSEKLDEAGVHLAHTIIHSRIKDRSKPSTSESPHGEGRPQQHHHQESPSWFQDQPAASYVGSAGQLNNIRGGGSSVGEGGRFNNRGYGHSQRSGGFPDIADPEFEGRRGGFENRGGSRPGGYPSQGPSSRPFSDQGQREFGYGFGDGWRREGGDRGGWRGGGNRQIGGPVVRGPNEYEDQGNYHEEGLPRDYHLYGGHGGRGGGYRDRGAGKGASERSGRGFTDFGFRGNRGGPGRGGFNPGPRGGGGTDWRGGGGRGRTLPPGPGSLPIFARGGSRGGGPGGSRGGGGPGGSGGGPLYGRRNTGELEHYQDTYRAPSLRDPGMFNQDKPPPREPMEENEEDDLPDAYYAVSGDQEDYGYGKEKRDTEEKRLETGAKSKKEEDIYENYKEGLDQGYDERGWPQHHYPSGGQPPHPNRDHPPNPRGHPPNLRGHPPPHGYSFDERRAEVLDHRMRKHYADNRYYGPGREDQFLHEVKRSGGEFGRDYILSRGTRKNERYYGPEDDRREARHGGRHMEPEESDQPYEGPTIFDKVFRRNSRKSSTDEAYSQSRSVSPVNRKRRRADSPPRRSREKNLSPEPKRRPSFKDDRMEAEFIKYKEKTEGKIRREKEKLLKYEAKIEELTNINKKVGGRPLDVGKYEDKKRRHEDRIGDLQQFPISGLRSEKRRDKITPPPGADLNPVLLEGDGECISDDEYDSSRYADFMSRGGGGYS